MTYITGSMGTDMVELQTPQHCEVFDWYHPTRNYCFISKGWSGRASDVYLTEHSSLLKNLLPGDVVLADRGLLFRILLGYIVQKCYFYPLPRAKYN